MVHPALRVILSAALCLPVLVASLSAGAAALRIRHIVEVVADLDRSVTFYTGALGFRLVSGPERATPDGDPVAAIAGQPLRRAVLAVGDEAVVLEQYDAREPLPVLPEARATDLSFQHFAIVVSDMDRAAAHLAQFTPATISSAPQTIPADNVAAAGIRAYKFRDPDGHPLELLWFPPDKGEARWHRGDGPLFLGIDHSAITIANTTRSTAFYHDVLGLEVRGGGVNSGETQDRLDGLTGARVRITGLHPPAPGGPGVEFLQYLEPSGGRPFPTRAGVRDPVTTRLVVEVDDLAATAARLGRDGATVLTPPGAAASRTQVVRDPDGHTLELVQP